MNYNFSQLNDKEFEILIVDLLSKLLSKRIERFKPGKDCGVDGRFFCAGGSEGILQCKHYLGTGLPGLMSNLRKSEISKIKKLSPQRYFLATSLPLSRKNKKEIQALLHPFILKETDILGQEDLNQLLRDFPDIEERHFKLWISSTTTLRMLLNNAVKGRSNFAIKQIRRRSKKYVQTENHLKSLNILKENRVIIVSGEPGIGKTTLAENLCLFFASKGYEFVEIQEDISEVENVFAASKKQLFYYDDFLGSNYFEAIENKKDSHVVKFIERIKHDKTKLLILTSRTNILNSGILHSCVLANNKIHKNEFLLTIGSLTKLDKAKILYNHIWHSKLPATFVDELYKDKRYKTIIQHRNFNPRLIEFIVDVDRMSPNDTESYWAFIQRTLDNPRDVWDDCFKRQSNPFVRGLVLLVVFNGGEIIEGELREAYSRLVERERIVNTTFTEKDFRSTAKLATKFFLNRRKTKKGEFYTLFNPSISDYILKEYCKEAGRLSNVFVSLQTLKSLEHLDSIEVEKIVSSKICLQIKNSLLDSVLVDYVTHDYLIYLASFFTDSDIKESKVSEIIAQVINSPHEIKYFHKFIFLLDYFYESLRVKNHLVVFRFIRQSGLNNDEITQLLRFTHKHKISDEEYLDRLGIVVEGFLLDELSSRCDEIDCSRYFEYVPGYDGDPEVEINYQALSDEVSNLGAQLLDDLDSPVIGDLTIDLEAIVGSIDVEEVVSNFFGSYEPEYEEFLEKTQAISVGDEIDDLFQRG